MIRALVGIVAFVVCVLLQGCASSVVYSNKDRLEGALQQPYGTSLYIDRNGSIYPPSSVQLAGSLFSSSGRSTATLRAYFAQPSAQDEWRGLLSKLGLPIEGDFDDLWVNSQRALVANAAQSIVTGSARGSRPIVFLVHGYNNNFDDADAWYRLVENDITARVQGREGLIPFFVRVHWDGLTQALPVNIWTRAQWNGPLTGLALRKVLKAMDGKLASTARISMLSHSTGALVTVNAVGDGSKALDCKENFKEHCPAVSNVDTLPDLVTQIRLGLLIPAASLDTFDYFPRLPKLPQAIILGVNQQDLPTNKGVGCLLLGSTCLNTNPVRACERLDLTFRGKNSTDVALFEFSDSRNNENQTFLFWETHGVRDQMLRDRWSSFIDRVLFPRAAGDSAVPECASPSFKLAARG